MTISVQGWVPDLDATLHGRLLIVRLSLGLTQREAATRSGLTFGEWQSIEAGRQARGLDGKVQKISAALGVDRNWLMWGAGSSNGHNEPTPSGTAAGSTPAATGKNGWISTRAGQPGVRKSAPASAAA